MAKHSGILMLLVLTAGLLAVYQSEFSFTGAAVSPPSVAGWTIYDNSLDENGRGSVTYSRHYGGFREEVIVFRFVKNSNAEAKALFDGWLKEAKNPKKSSRGTVFLDYYSDPQPTLWGGGYKKNVAVQATYDNVEAAYGYLPFNLLNDSKELEKIIKAQLR